MKNTNIEKSPSKKEKTSEKIKVQITRLNPIWKVLFLLVIAVALAFLLSPFNLNAGKYEFEEGDITQVDIKAPEDFWVVDLESTDKRLLKAAESARNVFDFDSSYINLVKGRVKDTFNARRQRLADLRLLNAKRATGISYQWSEYMQALRQLVKEFENSLPAEITTGDSGEATLDQAVLDTKRLEFRKALVTLSHKITVEPVELFSNKNPLLFSERYRRFNDSFPFEIKEDIYTYLETVDFDPSIDTCVSSVLQLIFFKGVITNDDFQKTEKGIIRNDLITNQRKSIDDTSKILTLTQAEELAQDECALCFPNKGRNYEVSLFFVKNFIKPNLTFNMKTTQEEKKTQIANAGEVKKQIKKNEMIVREGEKISRQQLKALESLNALKGTEFRWANTFGIFALVFMSLIGFYLYLRYFENCFEKDFNNALILGTVLVINVFFVKLFVYLAFIISDVMMSEPYSEVNSYVYLYPFLTGTILVSLLINRRVAMIYTTFMSLTAMLVTGQNSVAFATLIGGIGVLLCLAGCVTRTTLLKAGVIVGMTNFAVVAAFNLYNNALWTEKSLFEGIMGFFGGMLIGIIASGLLPLIEYLFNVTTEIRLKEFLSMDDPLLKELSIKAPGTYQHSIAVSNLSEAAAKAIGVNAVLSKVGAYYHDLGKVVRPLYYFENLMGQKNPHDKITSHMSVRIIKSHVTEGVNLAKQHKLPPILIDFIEQHHGTTRIDYFYNKALTSKKPEEPEINSDDFRYPGPKPFTKENAIVSMADSVEAAVRAIPNPTYENIKGKIHQVIVSKFNDEQLDNCRMTFNEVRIVFDVFLKVLTTMYHTRIQYPSASQKDSEKHNNGEDKTQQQNTISLTGPSVEVIDTTN